MFVNLVVIIRDGPFDNLWGWGAGEVQKKYSRKGKLNEKKFLHPNRPFYRYGGHIELIRFKEYYRMPRGHEHISFVFASAFGDIFS